MCTKSMNIPMGVLLLVAASLCLGCPAAPATPSRCEAGELKACDCPGGAEGQRRCSTDGTGWSACVCSPEQDAGLVDGSGPADGAAGEGGSSADAASSGDAGDPQLDLRSGAGFSPAAGSASGGSLQLRSVLRAGAAPAASSGGTLHLEHLGLIHE